jgi:lactose/L-arabinose transport system ATP-binding protein
MTLADKIVVLRAGKVEQVGAPLKLYDDPDNVFVAGFIGSPKMNFLPAHVVSAEGGQIKAALDDQPETRLTLSVAAALKQGDKVTLGLRPEHFLKAGQGDAQMTVTVDVTEHLGHTSYIYAHLKPGEQIIIEHEESRDSRAADKMTVGVSAKQAFLFDSAGQRLR